MGQQTLSSHGKLKRKLVVVCSFDLVMLSLGILEEEMCCSSSAAVRRVSDSAERGRRTVLNKVYN